MNVLLWIAVGFLVVLVIAFIVSLCAPSYSSADEVAGGVIFVAFVLTVIFGLAGIFVDEHQTKKEQKRDLQKIGFSYVNVTSVSHAVVSMPTRAKGCRLKLERDGNFWVLRLPKDHTRSITTADEVAMWPSVVEWCKQPQLK